MMREHLISISELLDAAENQQDQPTETVSTAPAEPVVVPGNGYRHDPSLVLTDVQAAAMPLIENNKREWVAKLLNDVFDCRKISNLRRDQWEEFIDTCETELKEGGK